MPAGQGLKTARKRLFRRQKRETARQLSRTGGSVAIRCKGRYAVRLVPISALGMVVGRRGRRTGAMLRHERIELFLVLGVTQAIEEILELDLLLFEPSQRIGAILVKGAIAARWRTEAEAVP